MEKNLNIVLPTEKVELIKCFSNISVGLSLFYHRKKFIKLGHYSREIEGGPRPCKFVGLLLLRHGT